MTYLHICFQARSGAYRDIVLAIFASHLKIVLKHEDSNGPPLRAMALCAAAVSKLQFCECTDHDDLCIRQSTHLHWWLGYPPDKSNAENPKTSFNEKPWAARTAGYLPIIKTLSPVKWDEIYQLATSAISAGDADNILAIVGELPEGSKDPRSLVMLSDDE